MSDSEDSVDESKIPSREECEERCKNFAEITGTDTALAMFYLQDREWNLDSAINAYFEQTGETEDTATPNKRVKLDTISFGGGKNTTNNNPCNSKEKISCSSRTTNQEDSEPNRLRIMTWNIDGLCEKAKARRTQTVCEIINRENPQVVFLQEVVPETLNILNAKCPTYHVVEAANQEYFTAVMLKVGVVEVNSAKVIPFTSSLMMRTLQKIECTVKGLKFMLLNSHLESTKDHATERKSQLKIALQQMEKAPDSVNVIFGGDLNLRDKELQEIGGLPVGIFDLWAATGSRKEAQYTWDLTRNTNLEWAGRFKPRCRFDRLYIRHKKLKSVITPKYLELVGIEKISSCGMFPSDHWGILTHFDVKRE